ncbi:MAG: DUF177 domain-containing protein [Pseudomonadota bacterium]
MRLLFDEITGKARRYPIADSQWFPVSEVCSVIAVTATICVFRQDDETVILDGEIKGRCTVLCDRCGESYEENLQSEFKYLATVRGEKSLEVTDQECSDEDALTLHLAEPIIEVDEILREQAVLAVPLKKLCSEDCRGICAGCGAVLNREFCRCQPEKNDSPFAVLEKMRNR